MTTPSLTAFRTQKIVEILTPSSAQCVKCMPTDTVSRVGHVGELNPPLLNQDPLELLDNLEERKKAKVSPLFYSNLCTSLGCTVYAFPR